MHNSCFLLPLDVCVLLWPCCSVSLVYSEGLPITSLSGSAALVVVVRCHQEFVPFAVRYNTLSGGHHTMVCLVGVLFTQVQCVEVL